MVSNTVLDINAAKEELVPLERQLREINEKLGYTNIEEETVRLLEREEKNLEKRIQEIKIEIKNLERRVSDESEQSVAESIEGGRAEPLNTITLNQIRGILYPRSNFEIKNILINLSDYFDPSKDKQSKDKATKFIEGELSADEINKIKEMVQSIPKAINSPVNNYIERLLRMVETTTNPRLGSHKVVKLNRPLSTPANIRIIETGNFSKNNVNVILPLLSPDGKRYEFSDSDYDKFSNFSEMHYTPIPSVQNKSMFMQRLTMELNEASPAPTSSEINSTSGSRGVDEISLPYMVEWLTRTSSGGGQLYSKLNNTISGRGKLMTTQEINNAVERVIYSPAYKAKNFGPLMQRYLFDESAKELLTKPQIERLEELLAREIGGNTILIHLLSVLDTKFKTNKVQTKNLADSFDFDYVNTNKDIQERGVQRLRTGRKKGIKKADISSLPTKKRRQVKALLQNAHPTEYFGEDYLRLGKVINIIDGLAEDEEAELLEKLGVKNLQMIKTAASLRKKYESLYEKLYDMVYEEE